MKLGEKISELYHILYVILKWTVCGLAFLQETFFLGGGKFYGYANFSIILKPNFKGEVSWGGANCLGMLQPPVSEYQWSR